MYDGLLVTDRIVLESIAKREKNIEQLGQDTGLKHPILVNALNTLVIKKIVVLRNNGDYYLNMDSKSEWYPDINLGDNLKEEIKDLLISLVNLYFKDENSSKTVLRFKKIWLTPFEEKILNAHFISIDSFFSTIAEERKRSPIAQGNLSDNDVIIWGQSKYSSLLDEVLEGV